jgi:hypothetical protein
MSVNSEESKIYGKLEWMVLFANEVDICNKTVIEYIKVPVVYL